MKIKNYLDILIVLPVLTIIVVIYTEVARRQGLYVITYEQLGKVFVAFLFVAAGMTFIRIMLVVLFNDLYKHIDPSFNQYQKGWLEMKPWLRVLLSYAFYASLLGVWGRILGAL